MVLLCTVLAYLSKTSLHPMDVYANIISVFIINIDLCLVHDPRNVEPKKPGRIKARKGYVYNRR